MKTLREFDYDLWTDQDGKCMARVKRTGEVVEVDRAVMRALRAEEKKLRRSFLHAGSDSVLSLDAICEADGIDEPAWLIDITQSSEIEVLWNELTMEFAARLTPAERSVFCECMLGGKKKNAYALEHTVTKQTVQTLIGRIQEKAISFPSESSIRVR